MKVRVIMIALFALGILLNGCNASINGHDIAHIDSAIPSTLQAKVCNVEFLFYEGYDSTRDVEFWYQVTLSNYEYRDANILISYKSGDKGPALQAFLGQTEEDHNFQIYIENGTKIIISVDRPDSNGVMQHCDAQEFKLEL